MNENQYRNGVPLQPNNMGLIISTSEVVHILGQLKSLLEAPGNSSTLTLGPISYLGGHKKGFILKHKCGLPSNCKERGGSHIGPNLHGWVSIASRISNHHGCRGRS